MRYLILLLNMLVCKCVLPQEPAILKDTRDGNNYATVTIGTQTWMAENLAYNSLSGCWSYQNSKAHLKTFGYMYTWEMARSVCPSGWHLPTDKDWTILTDYLGGLEEAGIKMKSITGWDDNGNGTNTSGFNGLAGGSRNGNGSFDYLGIYASWWSSDQANTSNARFRFLYKGDNFCYRSFSSKRNALYVRCLKNE